MNLKKIIAATTVVTVIATQGMMGIASAATTSTNSAWTDAVNFMKAQGLSSTADSVADYNPMATVKREAAAKFFVAFAKKEFGTTADSTKNCNFSDINEANSVFVPSIIEACQMGILKGANGKFMPKATLTKLQFLTVLARITKKDSSIEPAGAFTALKSEGITKADSLASTVRPVSRIELAMLFKRGTEKYATSNSDTSNSDTSGSDIGSVLGSILGGDTTTSGDTSTTTTTSGDTTSTSTSTTTSTNTPTEDKLVVSLDPATPADQYVPGTGTHIKVMKFDLTAGSKDVKLTAVDLKLEGMVNKDNIKNVYVEDENGVVLTNQRGFTTDYTARLVFNNNYVVKAGEIKALYVVMDVQNSTNELVKISVNGIDASSNAEGFPLTSNVTHTTAYSSTTVTFDSYTGAVNTNPSNKLYVGDTDKEIMKFTLTNGGQNNKDVSVKSLRFRGVDTLSDKIDNVKLIAGGSTVDATASIDGKYITFNLKNYVLKDGETKTFYVHANVIGGQANDKVQLYLDVTSDISAIENDTNAATSISATHVYGKAYKIMEGDNLITKSSTSPTDSYVANDADDVTVLVANVNTSAEMYVEKIKVYRDNMTATGADIKRVKLYVNDKYVDEASTTGGTTSQYYEFSYYGYLKGSNKFVVKVDTERNSTENNTIKFKIDSSSIADGSSNAEYVASKNNVPTNDIKGSSTSSVFTIRKPAIDSVTETSGLTNQKLIAGAQEALVAKYTFQANNVRDIKVTDLTLNVVGDTDNISTLKVAVDGQVVDTENVNGNSISFNSLNIPVSAGSTKEIEILTTLTTSYVTTNNFQVKLASVDTEDSKGNTANVNQTFPVNGNSFTVIDNATLYVNANSNTPVESVLAANPNTEAEVARFDFKATDGDAQIQELTLVNTGDASNAVTSGATADTGADSVINSVYVYDTNGNKLGTASLVNGAAYFTFSNPVVLPQDTTVTLVAKVKTNAINDISNTNKFVKFAVLKGGQTLSGSTKTTKIVTKANGNEITTTANYTNSVSNKQYFRKTIITLANNTQTTTTLSSNTNDIYLWSVTADNAGAAKILKFNLDETFGGSGSTATTTGYELYINNSKVNDSDVAIVAGATGGSTTVTIAFTGNYVNGYEVSANNTVNFKLVATDVSTDNNGDSIGVRLNNNGTNGAVLTGGETSTYSIIWTDEAADNVTGGTQDWFTDAKLPTLPLNSQTLSN